jgi:hypothetical protein
LPSFSVEVFVKFIPLHQLDQTIQGIIILEMTLDIETEANREQN